MTATIHHLPTVRRPTAAPTKPSHVTRLSDYRLTFTHGTLSWGPYYRRLTPAEAGDLSECLYWAMATSSKGRRVTSEPAPGIVIVGENPRVTVRGFGPALDWRRAGELIRELQDFYKRRSVR